MMCGQVRKKDPGAAEAAALFEKGDVMSTAKDSGKDVMDQEPDDLFDGMPEPLSRDEEVALKKFLNLTRDQRAVRIEVETRRR